MNRRTDRTRWGTALALIGVPVLVFGLPMLLTPDAIGVTSVEDAAFLSRERGSIGYVALLLQLLGGLLLVPATWGVYGVCARAGRGLGLARAGRVLGAVGAVALVFVIGLEFFQLRVLLTMTDGAAAVALVAEGQDWWVFAVGLFTALAAVFLLPLVVGGALVRARVVPLPVLAVVLLPVVAGFLPVPPAVAETVGVVSLLVPAAVLAAFLVRHPVREDSRDGLAAPRLAVEQV